MAIPGVERSALSEPEHMKGRQSVPRFDASLVLMFVTRTRHWRSALGVGEAGARAPRGEAARWFRRIVDMEKTCTQRFHSAGLVGCAFG